MAQETPRPVKVCMIAGTGHSGSTVVGMVLGSHPAVFYAGEAGKTRYLGNERKAEKKRVCKLCGPSCRIWSAFRPTEDEDLYVQISRAAGRPIVVDSSKALDWVEARLESAARAGVAPHLVFLQRDGRAVVSSRVRKYPGKDPRALIERWAAQVRRTEGIYEAFEGPKAKLRYELFATSPEAETRRLSALLGIDYRPEMLEFYRHEHHPLGGNNGTQSLVARARGASPGRPFAELHDRSRDYYEGHELGIRLDLRWRRELPEPVLELFDELAGPLNHDMRWDDR